ncbi:EIICBA-Glc [Sphingomonas paucimobilis]|nr:EIICBA-Glc [Sphingomonas paucimobilis]
MSSPMASLQSLGRALMLPIAVLPVAGLLLRLGQPDMLNIAFMANAGNAIFDNLGLLFAVGVATAFARDGNGAAALAGIACYLVTIKGAETLAVPPAGIGQGWPRTSPRPWMPPGGPRRCTVSTCRSASSPV